MSRHVLNLKLRYFTLEAVKLWHFMPGSFIVQRVGRNSSSESVLLGLTAHLRRVLPRVGFFKPVGTNYLPLEGQQYPRNVVLMHQNFKMQSDPASMSAMSEDAAFKVPTPVLPATSLFITLRSN